mmetsp:Transcript_26387/g.40020  ORF Transcript_26387/g.40020 Transcript_26387/m.40020 type:complete len:912 (-) Transcript_26387:122-2857(-)
MFRSVPLLLLAAAAAVVVVSAVTTDEASTDGGFNFQINHRIRERVSEYMDIPVKILDMTEQISKSTVIFQEPYLQAHQRDAYFSFMWSVGMTYNPNGVFYSQDDGMFMGFVKDQGTYLEGVGSGAYEVQVQQGPFGASATDNSSSSSNYYYIPDPKYQKYFDKCINENNGAYENCFIENNDSHKGEYIECQEDGIDGCNTIEPCPGPEAENYANCMTTTTSNNSNSISNQTAYCESQVGVWCAAYERKTKPKNQLYGYVPRYWYCVDGTGKFSETPGTILQPPHMEGTCKYSDGSTLVNGRTPSPEAFLYCGNQQQKTTLCDDIFVGGFKSRRYDHRLRAWYKETRQDPRDYWTKPYYFWTAVDLGVTYVKPNYYYFTDSNNNNKKVFRGAWTVNYDFKQISQILMDTYGGNASTSTSANVLIVEDEFPNYAIASSTGSKVYKMHLKSDPKKGCDGSNINSLDCEAVRLSAEDFYTSSNKRCDMVLVRALEQQQEEGYPEGLVVSTAEDEYSSDANLLQTSSEESTCDRKYYVSQSLVYEQEGKNLKWRIIVAMPATLSTQDSITPSSPLFGIVLSIAILGFLFCLSLFIVYYGQRKKKEVVMSDWRFSSAFILACALLNLSTLSYLGESTDATCMLRMWLVPFFVVLPLAPLLVKVWRMYQLVGKAATFRRRKITHRTAIFYTLPVLVTQVLILTIFTVVDPSKTTEEIDTEGGSRIQHVVCGWESETHAFMTTQMVFVGGLVVFGCYLAYKSRNLDSSFSEAKPMVLAMYNIAMAGGVVWLIIYVMDSEQATSYLVACIGIFWGTIFSSCAFVLPRLLRVRKREQRTNKTNGTTRRSDTSTNNPYYSSNVSSVQWSVASSVSQLPERNSTHVNPTSTNPATTTTTTTSSGQVDIRFMLLYYFIPMYYYR